MPKQICAFAYKGWWWQRGFFHRFFSLHLPTPHLVKMLGFLPRASFAPYRLRFCHSDEINAWKFFRRRNEIAAVKQTPRIQRKAPGTAEKLRHYRVYLSISRSEGSHLMKRRLVSISWWFLMITKSFRSQRKRRGSEEIAARANISGMNLSIVCPSAYLSVPWSAGPFSALTPFSHR